MDRKREKKVRNYITIFTILTVVPSVYLAYNIVTRTLWEKNAKQFLTAEFDFPRTQVIASDFLYNADSSVITLTLIGDRIEEDQIQMLKNKTTSNNLPKTFLNIKQSGDKGTDLNVLRSDILKDLYERNEVLIQNKDERIALLEREISDYDQTSRQVMDIAKEAQVNHQNLESFTINRTVIANLKEGKQDTLILAYAKFKLRPNGAETKRLTDWLKIRTKTDTVALVIDLSF